MAEQEDASKKKMEEQTIYEAKIWINKNGELESAVKVGKDLTPQILSFIKSLTYVFENKGKTAANRSRNESMK